MDEYLIEMSPVIFAAFMLHMEDTIRREVYAEIEEDDRRASEPIREHLERTRHALEWTERRDATRAAKEQRRQEILARDERAARTKESA